MGPLAESNENKSVNARDSAGTEPAITEQLKSQVATLETQAQSVENSVENNEIQTRIRHLIKLIKTSLQSRTLDEKTQKELARLLSLTPKLDGRHAQQLNLLDLAVSILLYPVGSGRSQEKGDDSASESAKNLVFVQETRRQISQQARPYPDLFRSIVITGGGTPYIRLISGLSWFFFIFVMTPLAVAGLTFAARDIAGFVEAKENIDILETQNDNLREQNENQQVAIARLTGRRDSLAAQLGRTSSQVSELLPTDTAELIAPSSSDPSSPSATAASPSVTSTVPGTTPGTTSRTAGETAPPAAVPSVSVPISTLRTIQSEINDELSSNINRDDALDETSGVAAVESPLVVPTDGDSINGAIDAAERIITTNFSLILLAVAMGALGSTISVIVRANTFIKQAQENNNDLFLTGFFRPFVGMSFAIFCVALVEAGIFSGVFDLSGRKAADRTYFYVAIAFVAGFSERLVRDVVVKTEDTLAGPDPTK